MFLNGILQLFLLCITYRRHAANHKKHNLHERHYELTIGDATNNYNGNIEIKIEKSVMATFERETTF